MGLKAFTAPIPHPPSDTAAGLGLGPARAGGCQSVVRWCNSDIVPLDTALIVKPAVVTRTAAVGMRRVRRLRSTEVNRMR